MWNKVFKKSYIKDIKFWQSKFSIEDPFGDFDLIFSSAFTGQKIVELPISYKERRYGTTQISRFRDGFKLLKYMVLSFIVFNTSEDIKILKFPFIDRSKDTILNPDC